MYRINKKLIKFSWFFVQIDHVAAGKQNWGSLLAKVGASFAAYVMGRVAKVMSDVITTAGEHGIAGYIANGMTDANWLNA